MKGKGMVEGRKMRGHWCYINLNVKFFDKLY